MTTIRIDAGEDRILEFGFDDLVRYHGTASICGLTVSLKIMEAAWDALWRDAPPKRDSITVASAFPGAGTKDGFEMVTRATSRDAYTILEDVKPGERIAEAAKGAYFFRLGDGANIVELGLKPAVVPEGFIAGRRKLVRGESSAEEKKAFRALQFRFSESLRGMAAAEAVNILDTRRAAGAAP